MRKFSLVSALKGFSVAFVFSIPLQVHAYVLDEGGPYDEDSIVDAVTKGEVDLSFRLRYEDVSQKEPTPQGGQALTLRSRLSLETRRFHLFSAGIRFDDISAIPDDKNYFNGSNAQTDDLFIADPDITELSEAWLAYDISNTLIKYGKQDFNLNNERLLGSNSWRQNTNSYYGVSVKNESLNYTTIEFARFTQFEGAGDPGALSKKSDPIIKVLNLSYKGIWLNKFSVYGLTVDGGAQNPLWSSETYGVHFDGDAGDIYSLNLVLDYAQQRDENNNPLNYKASYTKADLAFAYDKAYGIKLGYEKLGSHRDGMFVTPFASFSDFQGRSEQFLNNGLGNIEGGLIDSSLSLFARAEERFNLEVSFHKFRSDQRDVGLGDLGSELSAFVSYHKEQYGVQFMYADYRAKQYGVDQKRLALAFNVDL